jgi:ADP-ribose pyrophosphatase YjhB (NUDIX family)
VPLLIDQPRWPAHGRLWSHLISDSSLAELHAFADLLGLPPRSFEGDHYDVPAEHYRAVVAAGARPVSMRELVTALHASGLRRPKRKGERVLASTLLPDAGTLAGARVDLLASGLPAPVPPARIDVLVFAPAEAGHRRPALLVETDEAALDGWSLPWVTLAMGDAPDQAAARVVTKRTGVRLEPTALRICGHTRTLGTQQTWTTYLTTTLTSAPAPSRGALWTTTGPAPTGLLASSWWPLVDWLLDRRQPRTS